MVVGGGLVHFSSCLRVQLSSSLCIVNDELIVGNARTKETQSTFSIPVPSPSASCMPNLLPESVGNDAGFLHSVWDKPPVVSEVSV